MAVKLETQHPQGCFVRFTFLSSKFNWDLFRFKSRILRRGSKQEEHDEAGRGDPDPGHHERQAPIGLGDWHNLKSLHRAFKNHLNKCSSNGVPEDVADARVTVPNPHYEAPNTQCSNGANLAKSNIFRILWGKLSDFKSMRLRSNWSCKGLLKLDTRR